jgi:hypothetical protein
MGITLDTVDVVIRIDIDTVSILQDPFTPRRQKVSIPVKNNQWMLTA